MLVVQVLMGAVVEETVELRWLHSLRQLINALMSSWGDFLGPCTQVQGRGSCPLGHGPHN